MKLKSGQTYWPQVTRASLSPRAPAKNIRCDVAVVGAGVTGALVAYVLTKAGFDVAIFDKRAPGSGSTSASTALVLYEIDTPLCELIRMRGKQAAFRSYQRCLEAIHHLEQITRELRSRCEFRKCPSLYIANHPQQVAQLKKEYLTRKAAGFRVEWLDREIIRGAFTFEAPAAILSKDAGEVNPLMLTRHLLRSAIHKSARIFCPIEVKDVCERERDVEFKLSNGKLVSARWLVMACGFETKSPLVRRVVKLKSTFAMVTRPLKKFPLWPRRCSIWEVSRPYFYVRSTQDNRIMIGGGDVNVFNPQKRDRMISTKRRLLMNRLRELFPHTKMTSACTWAGTFGETKDGLPYIGREKKGSHILYALCYGANGTNFAMIAAEIIRDLLLKGKATDQKLFSFDR